MALGLRTVSELRNLVCDYSRLKAIAKGIASFFPEAIVHRFLGDLFAEGDGLLLDVSELHGVPTLTRDHVIRLERHLADDYTCTAHPFSSFFLRKREFIEADKKIRNLKINFVDVLVNRRAILTRQAG
jgi:hypothetical protein